MQRLDNDPQSRGAPSGRGRTGCALRPGRAGVPDGSSLGAGRRDTGSDPCARGGGTRGCRVQTRPGPKHVERLSAVDLVITMAPMAARLVMPRLSRRNDLALGRATSPRRCRRPREPRSFRRAAEAAYSRLARAGWRIGPRHRAPDCHPDRCESERIPARRFAGPEAPSLAVGGPPTCRPGARADRSAGAGAAPNGRPRPSAGVCGTRRPQDSRPLGPHHAASTVRRGDRRTAPRPLAGVRLPGIGGPPDDSVILLETIPASSRRSWSASTTSSTANPPWREFPTDQRGTSPPPVPPTPGDDVDGIARWPLDAELGSQLAARRGRSIAAADPRRDAGAASRARPLSRSGARAAGCPRPSPGSTATPMPLYDSTMPSLSTGII